jgi:hypothetical protein
MARMKSIPTEHAEARLLAARALRRTATPAERDVLDRATAEILRLKGEVARNFYELGYWLKRVRDEGLYRARGHATFEAYLGKDVGFSRGHAYTFMRVAERLPADFAVKLGVEKAEALLAYLDATPKEESAAEVGAVTIPVERDGKRVDVPVGRATVREIRAAVQRRARSRRRPAHSPALRAFLRRSEPALRRLGISVTAEDGVVRFGRIPFDKMADFRSALGKALGDK